MTSQKYMNFDANKFANYMETHWDPMYYGTPQSLLLTFLNITLHLLTHLVMNVLTWFYHHRIVAESPQDPCRLCISSSGRPSWCHRIDFRRRCRRRWFISNSQERIRLLSVSQGKVGGSHARTRKTHDDA